MATYAIGDVQGCFSSLQQLLTEISFDPVQDRLWFVGDLVNRGPDSLRVLRYVKGLCSSAVTVLGNHDLFLLAVAAGIAAPRAKDTIQEILAAPDRDELIHWLRHQRLLYREGPFVLIHAGLLPQWTIEEAAALALQAETALRGPTSDQLLRALYESGHLQWSPTVAGTARLAAITKVLTRLRICSADGVMESSYTGPPAQAPAGFVPWFQLPTRKSANATIICGHWAALGLHVERNLLAIDSGCVWGNRLTAIRLDNRQVFQVACLDGCGSD